MGLLISPSPALTVMASKNWSLQECVPTTKARFVFLMSLSTVLCCGNKDAQQLDSLLAGKADLPFCPFPNCGGATNQELHAGPTHNSQPQYSMSCTSPESAVCHSLLQTKLSSFFLSILPCMNSLLMPLLACWHQLPAGLPCLPLFTSAYQQLHLFAFLQASPTLYCITHSSSSSGSPLPVHAVTPCLLSPVFHGRSSLPHIFPLLQDPWDNH